MPIHSILSITIKYVSIIISVASLTAAIVPRYDSNGNPAKLHKYVDILALNVLNSAHHSGYLADISCLEKKHRPDSI